MFVSEFPKQISPVLGGKKRQWRIEFRNIEAKNAFTEISSVTIVQMQSLWAVDVCPGEVSSCSQPSQEQGQLHSNSVQLFFFCLFLLCLFYDKCYSEGLLPFAHFPQLSIIPGPVNSGLVRTCFSCCSSDFHNGAGKSDGFKWLSRQVGISLVS